MNSCFRIAFLILNVIAFSAYGVDKKRAMRGQWRISEATLFVLAILGGTPGSLIGQQVFCHKTKKSRFRRVFFTIVWVQVIIGTLWIVGI